MAVSTFDEDEQTGITDEGHDTGLVTNNHFRPMEGIQGDFDVDDYELPRLDIVQGVGDLSNDPRFKKGDLVIMREYVLPNPAKITVYGLKKEFVQNIKFTPGIMPKTFATKEEVIQSGGNLTKKVKAGEDDDNYVSAAVVTLIVHLPAELVEVPGAIDFENELLLPVRWYIRSANYSNITRRVNLVQQPLLLKGKTISYKYGLLSVELVKTAAGFTSAIAEFTPKGDNSEELVKFFRKLLP